ncbi:MAG: ISAzo13 family transposase, partial [Gammaproteobacteria bacterium]|nr:ISAzo13 family transposase [Gammaproteobacteria bacterium]
MRAFYTSLSEKDKRRYAALEARKLPYGGISYLCGVLGCDAKTIGPGLAELDELEGASPEDRIRKPGAGRKRALETIKEIDEIFLMVLENYTAGDPMQEQVRWTNLTYQEIIDH